MSQERKTSPMLLSRVLILFASAQFRTTRTDTPKRSSKKWLCPHTPVSGLQSGHTIGKESITPCSRRHPHSSEAWALAGVRKWMYNFASPIS